MTVREVIGKRVKAAMVVQVITILLAVIAAFTLPKMINFYVSVILIFSGLGVVLRALFRSDPFSFGRPRCGFPQPSQKPAADFSAVSYWASADQFRIRASACPQAVVLAESTRTVLELVSVSLGKSSAGYT